GSDPQRSRFSKTPFRTRAPNRLQVNCHAQKPRNAKSLKPRKAKKPCHSKAPNPDCPRTIGTVLTRRSPTCFIATALKQISFLSNGISDNSLPASSKRKCCLSYH